jgi:hypothetical protein
MLRNRQSPVGTAQAGRFAKVYRFAIVIDYHALRRTAQ